MRESFDRSLGAGGPHCFLHIPKCAGTSLRAAIEVSLGAGAVSPRRCDTYGFVEFDDYDALAPGSRDLIAVTDDEIDEMARYAAVTGHFRLQTLLAVTTPERIGTILREPRARLLSLFAFGRTLPSQASQWRPYPEERSPAAHAHRPLEEFLAEPLIAADTDNIFCRMLLDGVWPVPDLAFFSPGDMTEIADAAVTQLDRLGLTAVLELGGTSWGGFSRLFESQLSPGHANATEVLPDEAHPESAPLRITPDALALLSERVAADRLVYEHALAGAGMKDKRAGQMLSDAALANQFVRLGGLEQSFRESAFRREVIDLNAELDDARADLGRHSGWLEDLQKSGSWRMTAPLRSAKRRAQEHLASQQDGA